MSLVQASTILAAAKGYADAQDPNAGAWNASLWQPWLDSMYQVLFDRLLYEGAVTPLFLDTTLTYDPAVGFMTLAPANARCIVDVFRVLGGGRYEPLDSAQHVSQYPNLDLLQTNQWGQGYYGDSRSGTQYRRWAAFFDHLSNVLVNVSPRDIADTYLVRTVPDPNVSSGYMMPPVAADWMALVIARRALASEGVSNQGVNALFNEAEDALNTYLTSFQLKHDRKVTTAGGWGGPRNSALPSSWWWRG